MKKTIYYFSLLFCLAVGLLLSFLVPTLLIGGYLKLIFAIFLSTLIFTGLNYWSLKGSIPGYSFRPRFAHLFKKTFIIFGFIFGGSALYNDYLGINQFRYRYGNYMPYASLLTKNSMGQKLLKAAYSLTPTYSMQYSLMIAEESSKAFIIKNRISEGKLCETINAYDCFHKVYETINKNAPMTITGNTLMVAVGALITFKEKKKIDRELEIDPNPSRKNKNLTESSLRISNISLQAQNALLRGGMLRDQWREIPAKEQTLDLEKYSYHEREMLLIENVENQILKKFFKVSTKKITNILTALKSKKDICDQDCQLRVQSQLDLLMRNKKESDERISYVDIDYQEYFPLTGRFLPKVENSL